MSVQETPLPDRVDYKVTNRGGDSWHQYDGEELFSEDALERVLARFEAMRNSDYESIVTVKGSTTTRTKIRTKDLDGFKQEIIERHNEWVEEHGEFLTEVGNFAYGDPITPVVGVDEENARKTVVKAQYKAGYSAFIGGAGGKKQDILLPIRNWEQWSYHNEVVKPVFDKYHEKYPY